MLKAIMRDLRQKVVLDRGPETVKEPRLISAGEVPNRLGQRRESHALMIAGHFDSIKVGGVESAQARQGLAVLEQHGLQFGRGTA